MATKEICQRCVREIEIKTPEELQEAIKQLKQHYATMQYNDKTTIMEIWVGKDL